MNSGGFVSLLIQTFEMDLVKGETGKTIICTSVRNRSTGEQFEALLPAVQKRGFCYRFKCFVAAGLNSQTGPGCQSSVLVF